ncbi:MAG: transcriptional regulator [Mesorhizobium sp.]|uniref:helix-turn-helix transcriptional regulator n=1 Tax=unclassified Mesorhizobium TaxID=325217 RepID=UPI000FEA6528|nr:MULTISPECIES: transcriptional regulator [unclassified Mesorhizobium]RWC23437.1 MAG: transcriptional regulator [Mesorhizobium sp.]TGU01280.1 transcriptional regulator [Mesorhizobium sp. M5C.F.Ca.ET.164.01.1.1]
MKRASAFGDRPPSYVSKATLAAELDISESTVDDYVRRGILPRPIHLGGSVRWRWAQVQASLEPLNGAGQPNDPFMAGLKNVSPAA